MVCGALVFMLSLCCSVHPLLFYLIFVAVMGLVAIPASYLLLGTDFVTWIVVHFVAVSELRVRWFDMYARNFFHRVCSENIAYKKLQIVLVHKLVNVKFGLYS